MKAIVTRYHGPTYSRGSRYSATDNDGNRVFIDHLAEWSLDQCHQEAVKKLCRKMKWQGTLAEGFLLKGGAQYARVWVWLEFGQHCNAPTKLVVVGGAS